DASARGGEIENAGLGRVRHDAAHAARVLRLEDDAVELDVRAHRSEVDPDPVGRGGRGGRRERRFAHQRAAGADPFLPRDLEHAEAGFRSEFAFLESAPRRLARDGVVGFGEAVALLLGASSQGAEKQKEEEEGSHGRGLHHAGGRPGNAKLQSGGASVRLPASAKPFQAVEATWLRISARVGSAVPDAGTASLPTASHSSSGMEANESATEASNCVPAQRRTSARAAWGLRGSRKARGLEI